MENELISVIIPVYNVEKYLKECVDSIITQSYKNLEIILVDDGSTDRSGNICEQLSKSDKRISVIHKSNGGLSSARNAGIEASSGNYYMFIDSDDYIKEDMVEHLYRLMIKSDCDMTICNMIRFYDNGEIKFLYKVNEDELCLENLDRFETLAQPSVCNKMFKKYLFNNVRFPEGKYYEDTYVYHELTYNAKKIGLVDYDGYWYRLRINSILSNDQYNDKFFDAIDAVWHRATFLLEHNIQPYGNIACLSLYAYVANAEKHINKTDENKYKFIKAREQYLNIYKYIKNTKLNLKQRIRLVLLRYCPKIHCKLYQ